MLTDTKIKSFKPKEKSYKVGDSNGLYIYVTPKGTKYWRQKYRINGREKLLSHGEYPFISLGKARRMRDDARELLKRGKDPSLAKKARKADKKNSFEAIARQWHEKQTPNWSENHTNKVIISLEKDIFPQIGTVPIKEVTTPQLLDALRRIEKRGAYEQSRRVSQRCDCIFNYAIAAGLLDYNPAQGIQNALKKPKKQNYNHIDIKELPTFIRALENLDAHPIIKLATEMLMLTFVRTSELIEAEWSEIDLDNKLWEIPAHRMKKKRTQLVPLSGRVIEILTQLQVHNGLRQHVFASPRKPRQPLSNNSILQAIKRMGYAGKMTGHGFRHLASTTLNEKGYNPDAIERQLAHVDSTVRGVYNKAVLIEERTEIMNKWAEIINSHTTSS